MMSNQSSVSPGKKQLDGSASAERRNERTFLGCELVDLVRIRCAIDVVSSVRKGDEVQIG